MLTILLFLKCKELGVACQRIKACTSIPVEYSGFQVTGMIEESFTFEIFNSGSFLGRKIWQVFFLDGLIKAWILWLFKTI